MANKNILCDDLSFAAKEAYIRLRTNILFSFSATETDDTESSAEKSHVIGVTSSQPSEGKTTTSVNLAWSFAQLGYTVLLIDCDLRKPSINEKLDIRRSPGLSNILSRVASAGDTIYKKESTENGKSFYVIPSGDVPPNPTELLTSPRMTSLLSFLRTKFQYIILDLPPIAAVADAQMVSKLADGMLLVVKENGTTEKLLAESVRQLELAKSRILGFVLNGTEIRKKGYGYSSNSNYNYYK